jgi:hypothetical protein
MSSFALAFTRMMFARCPRGSVVQMWRAHGVYRTTSTRFTKASALDYDTTTSLPIGVDRNMAISYRSIHRDRITGDGVGLGGVARSRSPSL